ncbi:hypothetical protein GGI42DRAFT_173248 [Trichoderma sp. SZMC 28013]
MFLTHISLFSRCGSRLRFSDQAISYTSLFLLLYMSSPPCFLFACFWCVILGIEYHHIMATDLHFIFPPCSNFFALCFSLYTKNSSVAHVASFYSLGGGSRRHLLFVCGKKYYESNGSLMTSFCLRLFYFLFF